MYIYIYIHSFSGLRSLWTILISWAYVYIYIHSQAKIHTHSRIVHVYTYIHTCISWLEVPADIYTYMYTYICTCIHIYIYTYIFRLEVSVYDSHFMEVFQPKCNVCKILFHNNIISVTNQGIIGNWNVALLSFVCVREGECVCMYTYTYLYTHV